MHREASSIVVVSVTNPYPPATGKQAVTLGLLEYLVTRYGGERLTWVSLGIQAQFPDSLRPARVVNVPPLASWQRSLWLLARALRGSPLQQAMIYSPHARRTIYDLVKSSGVEFTIYDTLRSGQYAPAALKGRSYVFLDDLFSRRYRRMSVALKTDRDLNVDALGNFGRRLPEWLQAITRNRAMLQVLLRLEARRMERAERASVNNFAACLLVSADEVSILREASGAENVSVMTPRLAGLVERHRSWAGEHKLVWVGDLRLPHNHVGLQWYISNIHTKILHRFPSLTLDVIGRGASNELMSSLQSTDGVTVHGYVDDLDDALSQAAALIAPFRFGSGVKIKIVDAIARGLPVITTPIGAEGLSVGPERGILVADSVQQWLHSVSSVLDAADNAHLSEAAANYFRNTFSTSATSRQYDEIFPRLE